MSIIDDILEIDIDPGVRLRLIKAYSKACEFVLTETDKSVYIVNPENDKKKVINYAVMTMDQIYDELEELHSENEYDEIP